MSTPLLSILLADENLSLRGMLREKAQLEQRLSWLQGKINTALTDPDIDTTGVKVTERRDIRVTVKDRDSLDAHLFATGRHKLVNSVISLPGCTEQDLHDALQHVISVVGPTAAKADRRINTGSLKALIRRIGEGVGLPGVEVQPVVTRTAQLVDES